MFDMFLLDYFFDIFLIFGEIFKHILFLLFLGWDLFWWSKKSYESVAYTVAYRWFSVSPGCQSSSRNSRNCETNGIPR